MQHAFTGHQLPQLVLVFQWTAALCRIWPSSIPDAAPLHSLSSSALAAAGQLAKQLPGMQTDQQTLSAATDEHRQHVIPTASAAGSSTVELTGQSAQLAEPTAHRVQDSAELPVDADDCYSSHIANMVQQHLARRSQQQKSSQPDRPSHRNLLGDVTAAVLEVAAVVLQPLGMMLLQQQEAERQGTQPPGMSGPAKSLCAQMCVRSAGGTERLLQAMLAVCLHQLVLHAERKQQTSTQLGIDSSSMQQCPAAFSACGCSGIAAARSSSGSRSIAELAQGYLLQHANTLQAKQPAIPSRAVVSAWRAVSEKQWADMSLPLTLQEAATALASKQPSAAAASCSGVDGASSTSSNTSFRANASNADGLSAALQLEPALSLARCTDNAAALSALCMHLTRSGRDGATGIVINSCSSANALLSAAAALVRLQGAAALPAVFAAVAAVDALVAYEPTAQRAQDAATSTQLKDPAACAAGLTPSADQLQQCLSLAADLTTAVLQLDNDPAVYSSCPDAIFDCVRLLVLLLDRLAHHTDTAVQPEQLRSVACTLHLVEAAIRPCAAGIVASSSVLEPVTTSGNLADCIQVAYDATTSAMFLIHRADDCNPPAQILRSLQGQQLLQSCTSLLLTCSSIMQSSQALERQLSERPSNLAMYVRLLQLLQRSEPLAAGGSSPGMSQSLAAGLSLVGRCLVALGSTIGQPGAAFNLLHELACVVYDPLTCTPAIGDYSKVHYTRSSWASQILCLYHITQKAPSSRPWDHVDHWLLACSKTSAVAAQGNGSPQSQGTRLQARILQQAILDVLNCVESIQQTLQQHAAAAAAAAAAGHVTAQCCTLPGQASSSVSSSSTSSSNSRRGDATGSSADAQHSDPDQQQQHTPANWLLESICNAQQGCTALLGGVRAVLAPQLLGRVGGRAKRHAAAAAVTLASQCFAAGEAMCAAVPCSACCNNPRCSSLHGVSAGFALVRGKGCVCGGCLGLKAGGTAAVPNHSVVVAAR